MPTQLTFPCNTRADAHLPNGISYPLVFGAYEAVMIVKENGYEVGGSMTLLADIYPVTNVELVDGTVLHFPVPFYKTNRGSYKP